MKLALGSDHGGFSLKEFLKQKLTTNGVRFEDCGPAASAAVDYPDFAREVAGRVSRGEADQGILVCTTGIGMSIAANKFPGVRAALCLSREMAVTARTHNHANVLVLSGAFTTESEAAEILAAWLQHDFGGEDRHARRVRKLEAGRSLLQEIETLQTADPAVYAALEHETARQQDTLNMIASENYVSKAVRQAQGSIMTNKYAEGYPAKRWYNGCEYVDDAERLAIDRAKKLFGAEHVNVQPHCGSSANMAVYFAALEPGDTILAMSLAHGGHLTHGHNVNFSGRFFNVVSYGVSQDNERIDYDEVARLAETHRPKMIVAGASAYPRRLDFARFREIADSVGAYLMVDMAHIAGLVAAGVHPSPVPMSDFVTTTTHKTLRGPRAGMILCREQYAKDVDRQVFPGTQGGPLMHTIAAKAVCFHEALQPEFQVYAAQVVKNAGRIADNLSRSGFRMVSGGTDNHLMLVDLTAQNVTGKDAALALDQAGIIVNKNAIPFDTRSPFVTSGIRIGTPTITTRGMRDADMDLIAGYIARVLAHPTDMEVLAEVRAAVAELTLKFPIL